MPASDLPSDSYRAIEDLQQRNDALQAINDQMEAEKKQTANKHSKHLQAVTIISVIAALVSIGSTGFTLLREREQAKHTLRNELTTLIQRLTTLQDQDQDNSDEYQILGRLAYNTASRIEDQVSAPEHSLIAGALLASGDFIKSQLVANKAVRVADNMYDKTWALRQLAWIEFQVDGDAKGGSIYTQALETYKQYGQDENSPGVKSNIVYTYVEWSKALAVNGKCREAEVKKDEYLRWLPAVVFRNERQKLKGKENDLLEYLRNCHEGQLDSRPDSARQH
jgi:hypothetical protein